VNPSITRCGGLNGKVQTEDIIKEVKRHSFYLKPGERKPVKEALARKRSRKKARKEQD
jgi:small subunit ribosomal protein S21